PNGASIRLSTYTALPFSSTVTHAPRSTLAGPGFIHFAGGDHDLLGAFSPEAGLRFSGVSTRIGLHAAIAPTGIVTNNGAEVTFHVPQAFAKFSFEGGRL